MNWHSIKWRIAWFTLWVMAALISILAVYVVVKDSLNAH